jgi:glucokinase
MMSGILAVGIDVGGTNTKIGLVDSAGEILAHRVIPSELQTHDPALFLASTGAVVEQFLSGHLVQGIGISLCSIVNEARTGVLLSVNAPALAGLDVRAAFAQRFDLPVQVSNDVSAYALAETRFGAGKNVRRLLCLALGTGLAIAAVIDGRVIETWGGISADAGRIILDPDSDVCCKAGVRGSAEALIGVAHIERLARAAYGRADVTAREVIAASRDGDLLAGNVMAQIGSHVGHLLALLSPVFFPQRILITGGTAEAGEPLFAAARERHAALIGDFMAGLAQLDSGSARAVEIQKAALGPEAAVIGAVQGFF